MTGNNKIKVVQKTLENGGLQTMISSKEKLLDITHKDGKISDVVLRDAHEKMLASFVITKDEVIAFNSASSLRLNGEEVFGSPMLRVPKKEFTDEIFGTDEIILRCGADGVTTLNISNNNGQGITVHNNGSIDELGDVMEYKKLKPNSLADDLYTVREFWDYEVRGLPKDTALKEMEESEPHPAEFIVSKLKETFSKGSEKGASKPAKTSLSKLPLKGGRE